MSRIRTGLWSERQEPHKKAGFPLKGSFKGDIGAYKGYARLYVRLFWHFGTSDELPIPVFGVLIIPLLDSCSSGGWKLWAERSIFQVPLLLWFS